MNALGKVKIDWSPNFAYVIGLIASDGNLSSDGRHINFTSKDYELILYFQSTLCLNNKIGKKGRGGSKEKIYFVIQFGDVLFYRFLNSIGLTSNKSKSIGKLNIPGEFFFDFLRGCIDGDGSISTFRHPESIHPQLRVRLCSASREFLEWIHAETQKRGITGYINKTRSIFSLIFAISSSKKLLSRMYYIGFGHTLSRKYEIAKPYLSEVKTS